MDNPNDIDLIEKYLNNEVTETERQSFDRRIRKDEALAQEFQRRQTAHNALDYLIAKNLREELRSLETGAKVVPIRTMKSNRLLIWSVAASLLLVVAFFFLFQQGGKQEADVLAEAYYEAPELNIRGGSDGAKGKEILSRGVAALKNKRFPQAILTLDSVAAADPFYIEAQYHLGHAYYQTQQWVKAEKSFNLVAGGPDIRFKEDAEWFAVLTCMAQKKNCATQLDPLINNKGHAHHQQALKLKKSLK